MSEKMPNQSEDSNVIRFEDHSGVIHTAKSPEEMAQMLQDEREAA